MAQAEAEISAAAAAWPGAGVLRGADATAEAVSRLAGSVDVLHVSAHGRHSSENQLFSASSSPTDRGSATTSDQLAAVPDVVLLSACEVGRSTLRGGEELIGMTAAWLHAGSRCVIASAAAITTPSPTTYSSLCTANCRPAIRPRAPWPTPCARSTRTARPRRWSHLVEQPSPRDEGTAWAKPG